MGIAKNEARIALPGTGRRVGQKSSAVFPQWRGRGLGRTVVESHLSDETLTPARLSSHSYAMLYMNVFCFFASNQTFETQQFDLNS